MVTVVAWPSEIECRAFQNVDEVVAFVGLDQVAMRGLTVFISDLRNCSNKEQEAKRVEKEMAHIRSKFTSDTHMNGYNRKKYVWKILYMYMLGYEVDFGHMEAVNLISSQRYSEKSVGYAWCALMLKEGDELLRLIINSIRVDLISKNDNAICLVHCPSLEG